VKTTNAALILSLLFACAPKSPQPPGHCGAAATAALPVTEVGPFHVGYRKFPLTYQAPGVDAPRTVLVNVWYPTTVSGEPGTSYLGIFPDADSQENVAPAPPLNGCGYPVLAYSHGSQGLGGGAAYMMRYFASHGWVGVAPDHAGNTFNDNLDVQPTSMFYLRSVDISHSLDALEQLQAPDPLAGHIATDKILMVGHSYGGMAAWGTGGVPYDVKNIEANCHPGGTVPSGVCTPGELAEFTKGVREPRVAATIAMADTWKGDWFGATGFDQMKTPVLAMSGSENQVHTAKVYNAITGVDYTWIELAGGCHETFNLGFCETLDTQVGYSVVETYALAFARYHVLGDHDATVTGIVNGTTPVSAIVTYRKK
jgi:predicted dienelactone hydrolase